MGNFITTTWHLNVESLSYFATNSITLDMNGLPVITLVHSDIVLSLTPSAFFDIEYFFIHHQTCTRLDRRRNSKYSQSRSARQLQCQGQNGPNYIIGSM